MVLFLNLGGIIISMNFEVTNTVKHPELFVGNSWTLPTDIGLVTEAEEAFVDKLEECEWDKTSDDVNKLQIAFREAIINAIAHGNLHLLNKPEGSTDNWGQLSKKEQELHPTDKKIFINIEVSKTKVMLTIRDEGDGFNWMQAPDPTIGA